MAPASGLGRAGQTGYRPVVMGAACEFGRHEELLGYVAAVLASGSGVNTAHWSVDQALAAALAIDVPAWLAARAAEQRAYLDMDEVAGEWPEDGSPQDTPVIP